MATLVEAWASDPRCAERCNLLVVGGDLDHPSADEAEQITRIAASVANSFAFAASTEYGRPASRSRAAARVSARAADTAVAMSASRKPMPWKSMIARPNCSRSRA